MTSPKNAWTDDNDLRWYTFNDRDYLSVTSLRKVMGLPFNLHRWVLKQTLEAVQKDPTLLERVDKKDTPASIRGRIMRAGMKERDKAAERGTDVHEAIATGQPIEECPAELQPFMRQYAEAVISLGIQPLLSEKQVFNNTYGYAGSFDLLATVRAKDNRPYIIDLKTGKGTYPDHALQGMAYLSGEFIGEDDKVDDVATDILRTIQKQNPGIGILHLQPDGWKFYDLRVDAGLKQAFKAQAVIAQWMARYDDISKLEVTS